MSSSLSQWVWAVLINILGEKCCLVDKISVVFTCSNDINKRIPLSLVNQFPVCHYIEMGMDCFQYLFPSFVHVLQKLSQIQTLIGLWTNNKWGKSSTQIDKTICTRVWLIWNRKMQFKSRFPCSLIIITSESGANGRTMMSLCYWWIIGGAHDLNSQ